MGETPGVVESVETGSPSRGTLASFREASTSPIGYHNMVLFNTLEGWNEHPKSFQAEVNNYIHEKEKGLPNSESNPGSLITSISILKHWATVPQQKPVSQFPLLTSNYASGTPN